MGELERKSKQKKRRANLQKMILQVVAVAGVVGVAMVAPNVIGAMARLGFIPSRRQKEVANLSRDRLIRRGLLSYHDGRLRLTPKGEAMLRILELRDYHLKKPKRWDGKWRVLIFDIREKRKSLRERIRRTLIAIGFQRLQDSVWIYPYDCEDLITLLKSDFQIGKDVLYLVVDQLEYDAPLKAFFCL
ncbi:MAG: hypothetical protein HYS44_02565 [Candidatus Niyogibacteria bacterium]|nr:hypothetical protein [Candidatus Niyogibacteria bacterium]